MAPFEAMASNVGGRSKLPYRREGDRIYGPGIYDNEGRPGSRGRSSTKDGGLTRPLIFFGRSWSHS
jgi:hypothetical protein